MNSPTDTDRETVVYVYGVVPADVEIDTGARGVGDPPSSVDVVRHRDVAVLVSEIPRDRPLGRPEDLSAHAELLDAAAAEVPVLPMRFGGVVADRQAAEDELLAEHHDQFVEALTKLEGKAQYVVKGRYVESAILQEILAEDSTAAELRERIKGKPEEATRDDRIALGELISKAVAAKRDADTRTLHSALEPICEGVAVREPTHERDAVHLACLGETERQSELVQAVEAFAREQAERVEVRVLGPMAAYDFVMTREPG